MNTEKFEKDMAAFSFGQHQDFLTYLKRLGQFGYSIDDVENYVNDRKSRVKTSFKPGPQIKCPECGAPMMVLPVNDKPSTKTGDNSRSVLICNNKGCMHTVYSEKTAKDMVNEIRRKPKEVSE